MFKSSVHDCTTAMFYLPWTQGVSGTLPIEGGTGYTPNRAYYLIVNNVIQLLVNPKHDIISDRVRLIYFYLSRDLFNFSFQMGLLRVGVLTRYSRILSLNTTIVTSLLGIDSLIDSKGINSHEEPI